MSDAKYRIVLKEAPNILSRRSPKLPGRSNKIVLSEGWCSIFLNLGYARVKSCIGIEPRNFLARSFTEIPIFDL